jgi:hypothetical protein
LWLSGGLPTSEEELPPQLIEEGVRAAGA